MNKKKAVIFDLDGVIVDTAKYHFIAWQQIAKELGIRFTKNDNELLKGVSRAKSLEIILKLANKELSATEKQILLDKKNKHYLSLIADMKPGEMLAGINKLLKDLQAENIPFALGSASKNAKKILKVLQIIDVFDAIVDGNDVKKAKPDPEVFLKAAGKLKVKPQNCVVIEDAQAGIIAANKAGMFSIGIGDEEILKDAGMVLPDTAMLNVEIIKSVK
jgi:beta-phosphoglucomutase